MAKKYWYKNKGGYIGGIVSILIFMVFLLGGTVTTGKNFVLEIFSFPLTILFSLGLIDYPFAFPVYFIIGFIIGSFIYNKFFKRRK